MTAVAASSPAQVQSCAEVPVTVVGHSAHLMLNIPGVRLSYPTANTCRIQASHGGVRDDAGSPLAGVAVTLYDVQGLLVATTVTDRLGNWAVDGLPREDYVLEFNLPNAYPAMSLVRQAS